MPTNNEKDSDQKTKITKNPWFWISMVLIIIVIILVILIILLLLRRKVNVKNEPIIFFDELDKP